MNKILSAAAKRLAKANNELPEPMAPIDEHEKPRFNKIALPNETVKLEHAGKKKKTKASVDGVDSMDPKGDDLNDTLLKGVPTQEGIDLPDDTMPILDRVQARLVLAGQMEIAYPGWMRNRRRYMSDAERDKLDRADDTRINKLNAKAKTVMTKFKADFKEYTNKVVEQAFKLGVPKSWAKNYCAEYLDEQIEGMEETPVAPDFKKEINAAAILAEYNSDNEGKGIESVRMAGQKMAQSPSNKVKLLQKLGLSGPEFVALCVMIKEQIK